MDLNKIKLIAVDADDTLWDNQTYYDRAEDVFTETLQVMRDSRRYCIIPRSDRHIGHLK